MNVVRVSPVNGSCGLGSYDVRYGWNQVITLEDGGHRNRADFRYTSEGIEQYGGGWGMRGACPDLIRAYGFQDPVFSSKGCNLSVDAQGTMVEYQVENPAAFGEYAAAILAHRPSGFGIKSEGLFQVVMDLGRVDFVRFGAPSVLIRGFPGRAARCPSGFGVQDPASATLRPGALEGRPVQILLGSPGSVSEPSWSGGGLAAPPQGVPDPGGPVATRTWQFDYDGNQAELAAVTDYRGLRTAFQYGTVTLHQGLDRPAAHHGAGIGPGWRRLAPLPGTGLQL
jgi:hypothetical protein